MITTKLIAVIFGSIGFWKIIEVLLKYRMEKAFKKAETSDIYAQANTKIISNWIKWSEKMEHWIKNLETENTNLKNVILQQEKQINDLEQRLQRLEKSNFDLSETLKKMKHASQI